MSRIINTAKVLRRNWKKSTFFFGVLAYGASYFKEKLQTQQMMRAYCEEARKYGEKPLTQLKKPKHVTVILNPEANYKKSNVQFEKFAAPLLHLAGFKVSVFQTEKEKQAQELMQVMTNTDAVIVAGGNGTLQEVVTGLLLRPNPEEDNLPLGIIPLGKTNTIAEYLFGDKSSSRAQLMAEAVMAVIRETTVKLDVLKVQYLDDDKPVFAMCNFEQGILSDVDLLVQKYWYLGSLKERFTYFVNSLKEWKSIENHHLEYVAPCSGCSKCYLAAKQKEKVELPNRWWHVFVPKTTDRKVIASANASTTENVSNKTNEDCGKRIELAPEYSSISIATTAVDTHRTDKSGSLSIKIFPKELSIKQFISSGLSHRKSKQQDSTGIAQVVNARELIIGVDSSHQTKSLEVTEQVEQSLNSGAADLSNSVSEESSALNDVQSAYLDNDQSIYLDNVSTNLDNVSINLESCESPSLENVVSSDLHSVESSISNNVESSALENIKLSNSDSTETLSSDNVATSPLDIEKTPNLLTDDMPSPEKSTENLQSTESLSSNQTESPKDSEHLEQFSYIDHEKYRRASCKISVLPKQVTVFG